MNPFSSIAGRIKQYLAGIVYRHYAKPSVIRHYRCSTLPSTLERVAKKPRINVVFLAMSPDMWKYDGVYRRFANDPRFNPVIVTAMRNIPDMALRLREQETMVEYFNSRGYNVVKGYDTQKRRWIRLKTLKPDIIFYTQPYNGIIQRQLQYFNNLDALHCYSPYSFQVSEAEWNWDTDLQQYCWKVFYVNSIHLEQCARHSRIGNVNAVAAGYCLEEEYAEAAKDKASSDNAWRNDARKRVIWAPHHSIEKDEWFKVSSFLEIADLMVRLREEYKDRVLFAFKPHPVLKPKLYTLWGREKTDEYYRGWQSSSSSFDAQGDYHALFAGSDAMIHCSGSFMVEYLYTGKPVQYVYSATRNPPDMGPLGDLTLSAHYPARSEADIRRFLDDVVLGGNDTMQSARNEIFGKYLKSPNGKPFSENVYNTIVEGLGL